MVSGIVCHACHLHLQLTHRLKMSHLLGRRFVFKKMVECGMPKFAHNKSLHILIADCDFPDCVPYFYNKVRPSEDCLFKPK